MREKFLKSLSKVLRVPIEIKHPESPHFETPHPAYEPPSLRDIFFHQMVSYLETNSIKTIDDLRKTLPLPDEFISELKLESRSEKLDWDFWDWQVPHFIWFCQFLSYWQQKHPELELNPVELLNLPTRQYYPLKRNNVDFIEQIKYITEEFGEAGILSIRSIGTKSTRIILEAVNEWDKLHTKP